MTRRTFLSIETLSKAGATVIGIIKNANWVGGVPMEEELSRPGFYFITNIAGFAVSRSYVGRQRSKTGFSNTLSQFRQGRSQLGRTLSNNNQVYSVVFVPVEKMKPLTTGHGKGQLSLAFTRKHEDAFQNLEEMNRMLNDNFKFIMQKY
ncbi:nucleoid disruption protein [Salmonella phage CF-SP2]|nr:nucleoid disruption protein [Salmonella phage CF-SP2]